VGGVLRYRPLARAINFLNNGPAHDNLIARLLSQSVQRAHGIYSGRRYDRHYDLLVARRAGERAVAASTNTEAAAIFYAA
jgi:hypothetical protein